MDNDEYLKDISELKIPMVASRDSLESVSDYIENFSNPTEKLIAYTIYGMTINTIAKMAKAQLEGKNKNVETANT